MNKQRLLVLTEREWQAVWQALWVYEDQLVDSKRAGDPVGQERNAVARVMGKMQRAGNRRRA
jgi:hypothetical protein